MKGVFIVLAVASLCACGGSGGSTTGPTNQGVNTPPVSGGISVGNNMFSPGTKTVAVGTTVRWAWSSCTGDAYSGQTCVSHSVTFDDGSLSSPPQDQGTFDRTFNAAGTFTYHCQLHGAAMTGTITVQ
jgi:plastocyanin